MGSDRAAVRRRHTSLRVRPDATTGTLHPDWSDRRWIGPWTHVFGKCDVRQCHVGRGQQSLGHRIGEMPGTALAMAQAATCGLVCQGIDRLQL